MNNKRFALRQIKLDTKAMKSALSDVLTNPIVSIATIDCVYLTESVQITDSTGASARHVDVRQSGDGHTGHAAQH